jgi:hypothetical protein
MEKNSFTERNQINNCEYLIAITEQENDLYVGTAICLCEPMKWEKFKDSVFEVVYVKCIEWLNQNCKK